MPARGSCPQGSRSSRLQRQPLNNPFDPAPKSAQAADSAGRTGTRFPPWLQCPEKAGFSNRQRKTGFRRSSAGTRSCASMNAVAQTVKADAQGTSVPLRRLSPEVQEDSLAFALDGFTPGSPFASQTFRKGQEFFMLDANSLAFSIAFSFCPGS